VTIADPSAPPVRERGVRTRAGNAMGRTRSAVLDGAVRAVEKYGARRATMADIAGLAGVAKGTLYNHFRTKDAVYAAAVEAEVRSLAAEAEATATGSLGEAFAVAADRIASHAALRRLAVDEPGALVALTTFDDSPTWAVARDGVSAVLQAGGVAPGAGKVELVLRWLASFVTAAGGPIAPQAELLAQSVRTGDADSDSSTDQ
jgi:AcrR family transcriptional regulator